MNQIRLDSATSTLILCFADKEIPWSAYWGRPLPPDAPLEQIHQIKPVVRFPAGLDSPYGLNLFPEQGTGFSGRPALMGHRSGTHWANRFQLKEVNHPKQQVILHLKDPVAKLQLTLDLHLDWHSGILRRRTHLTNCSKISYQLQYCAAAAFAIPTFCSELLTFHGGWTGEFMTERRPWVSGISAFENRSGRTSHECFPALIAGSRGFDENGGTVYGAHLGWSGNVCGLAEVLPDGSRQIQFAELLAPGEVVLAQDETYTTPWVYAGVSDTGLNGLSHGFHRYLRQEIIPPKARRFHRPVQFNSWEAIYFDHDLDRLKQLASQAAALGMERFVLDDGWFHHRVDATKALGDWWPDQRKYPQGLTPLVEHLNRLGLTFGLWVEPEMVSPTSTLYQQHPDWILSIDGLPDLTGREQLVLDLSRKEVIEYLFQKLSRLLSQYPITYLKWDMNRPLTMAAHGQRPAYHRQTTAVYQLIDRLRQAYPQVEIESCASGGGRIDFEMARRIERFWASDSNDPYRRQMIQRGATLFFPPELTGSHIGPAESHTSGRVTDIHLRAQTAFFYHLGCELDLTRITAQEYQLLSAYIALHKRYRPLLHTGRYVRLVLDSDQRNGYGVVADNSETALFSIFQLNHPDQINDRTIRFSHLDPDGIYRVKLLEPLHQSIRNLLPHPDSWLNGFLLPAGVLMDEGVSIWMPYPGTGVLIELKRVPQTASE